ncbi:alkaline phosphatase D family protein [soil metagenome]
MAGRDGRVPRPPASLSRRQVLRGAAGVGATALVGSWLVGCSDDDAGDAGAATTSTATDGGPTPPTESALGEVAVDTDVFAHGVASGDPTPGAVILWTRVTTDAEGAVEVEWEVATDEDFTEVVAAGTAETSAERDHTVKVDAIGLAPGTDHHYRFVLGGEAASPTGRTRTAPEGSVEGVRFGVVSCSNYAFGAFHAYRNLADQDVDVVLHLGDYIYEGGGATSTFPLPAQQVRAHDPTHEIVSLGDYRTRYAQYRTDPDLQALHARFPFVTVWDDHEITNNAWSGGASSHDPATEGSFADRRAAATQAYFEWLPIRDADDEVIYRQLTYGDLVDLLMLDTRLVGRQEQGGGLVFEGSDPDLPTELLGSAQEAWLTNRLGSSKARWKVLGQQLVMSLWQLGEDTFANDDQWNGYPEARQRLVSFIADNEIDDVVVLTGDVHSSWAMDVTDPEADYDPETGAGAVAVELVTPGITSPGGAVTAVTGPLQDGNAHIKYADAVQNGYLVVDFTPERVQGTWFYVDGVGEGQGTEVQGPTYEAVAGTSLLTEAT